MYIAKWWKILYKIRRGKNARRHRQQAAPHMQTQSQFIYTHKAILCFTIRAMRGGTDRKWESTYLFECIIYFGLRTLISTYLYRNAILYIVLRCVCLNMNYYFNENYVAQPHAGRRGPKFSCRLLWWCGAITGRGFIFGLKDIHCVAYSYNTYLSMAENQNIIYKYVNKYYEKLH